MHVNSMYLSVPLSMHVIMQCVHVNIHIHCDVCGVCPCYHIQYMIVCILYNYGNVAVKQYLMHVFFFQDFDFFGLIFQKSLLQ